ncbi:acyl-CoA synthetase [Legionella wadsworthii]|uniref:Acyl-CoA synthetase n=1 Tax=Legionella wadsworthii TaxID=28088 RepID=A0A378LPS3_9GAMM|nr:aminotransferase class I/II-fold pyridoxal phosphate-dependent enzyme [Legionella wadsworthii]STY28936.1 acyl-CoA synthetase [Legionella wadsworthii]
MQDFISIVDTIKDHATRYPDSIAIKFLTQKGYETLTYKELDTKIRSLAQIIQEYDFISDERAVILLPPCLDYIVAFFACLYTGVIAVPVYPPRKNQHKERVFSILDDSKSKFIITNQSLAGEFTDYSIINIDTLNEDKAHLYQHYSIEQDKVAFLQYTSGSTSVPKGVLINHLNLISNIKAIVNVSPYDGRESHKVCSWLPPYHDMGLIGCILTPLYKKVELILMAPAYFLNSPVRWLEVVTQERITITCVPNFAFDYCVSKITDARIKHLDLSTLECIYNGSEPIQFESIQQFIDKFSAAGLSQQAIYSCYGLAEATLMLTAKQIKDSNHSVEVIKSDFESGKISISQKPSHHHALIRIVNCGRCPPEHSIRIVDPNTHEELPETSIGEIWASGPSIASGYWNQKELTEATFKNTLPNTPGVTYLRTGDLGFISQGDLYITGRIKDLIIIRGKNYYPQDIELIVLQNHKELETQGAAAFSIEENNKQELVILLELKRNFMRHADYNFLFTKINALLLSQFGLITYAIVLVKPYTLPKTSSGKIQRSLARRAYRDNTLQSIASWHKNAHPESNTISSFEEIKKWITEWLIRRINMPLSEHDYDKSITSLGINSIAAVELANELQAKLGKQFELLPLFEQYSLNQLVTFLAENLSNEKIAWDKSAATTLQLAEKARIEKSEPIKLIAPPVTFGLRSLSQNPNLDLDQELIKNLKRVFFNVNEGISNNTTVIDGTPYINYSGYNYLGLSGNEKVTEAVIDSVKKWGTSVSASRLVSGEKLLHVELEKAIADLIGTEDSLVFPSGYATNITAITHLFGKNDLIIHDSLAHNSILQAALFSGAERISFPHNDYLFLTQFLEKYRDQYRKVLLVTEGIFSMDGDIADVPKLISLKKQFNTFLMIDEAHSIGVLGKTGKGIREYYNLDAEDVDIWMGTLSKAFASCGGYIAGTHELIENLKYMAAGFVYSAGISPANTAAALAAIQVMKEEPERISQLQDRHTLLLSLLMEQNIPTGLSKNTPIIPIVVGEDSLAVKLSHYLKDNHILALPIIYPAVEKNLARVRLFVNCLHSDEQIYQTVNTLRNYPLFKNKAVRDTKTKSLLSLEAAEYV